jgi:Family of unknown function (DUF6252)
MKTNKFFSIALLPLLMLSLQHCDKNDPKPKTELEKLPPATQSGKRTFGCLVDGKAWVTEQITHVQAYYQTGTLGVNANLLDNRFYSNISFYVSDFNLTEKTYQFSQFPGNQYALYHDVDSSCDYYTATDYKGTVTITHLDKINFILSGMFEFEAYSDDCSQVVKITEGRFDVHYAA